MVRSKRLFSPVTNQIDRQIAKEKGGNGESSLPPNKAIGENVEGRWVISPVPKPEG